MEYLTKALENKFSKTVNELASELIFTPLAMTNTQYVFNESLDLSTVAAGYENQGKANETTQHQSANGCVPRSKYLAINSLLSQSLPLSDGLFLS